MQWPQLVDGQIQEEYKAKDEHMARYLSKVQTSFDKLNKWLIKRISRSENPQADALVGLAATLPIKEAVSLPVYL